MEISNMPDVFEAINKINKMKHIIRRNQPDYYEIDFDPVYEKRWSTIEVIKGVALVLFLVSIILLMVYFA